MRRPRDKVHNVINEIDCEVLSRKGLLGLRTNYYSRKRNGETLPAVTCLRGIHEGHLGQDNSFFPVPACEFQRHCDKSIHFLPFLAR